MSEIPHPNLTRLAVKNYRSLLDIDLSLHPLTVLVGENGTGKSNVCDVLRFLRDALNGSLEQAVEMRGGMSALHCWFADEREPISIQLEFCGPLNQWSGSYGLSFVAAGAGDEVRLQSETLSLMTATADKAVEFSLVDGQVRASNLKYSETTASANQLYLPQLQRCNPSLTLVHDLLAKMSFYDLKPDNLRQPQPLLRPFPLLERGENLASALLELQKREQAYLITESLDVIADGLTGYNVERVNGHLITKLHYSYHNGHRRKIASPLWNEADGTIRMLALLTALYQERHPSLLVVEKPEKDIYSRKLAVSREVLDEATLRYQVLVTTHSPDFIDELPVDSFLVVEKEQGITKIGPVVLEQRKNVYEKEFSLGELMQIEGLQREGGALQAKI